MRDSIFYDLCLLMFQKHQLRLEYKLYVVFFSFRFIYFMCLNSNYLGFIFAFTVELCSKLVGDLSYSNILLNIETIRMI